MVPKSFIVLGLVLAVVLFISSEVAAKDLETAKGIEDDRGFNEGGRGGFNNGGGRGGYNNGGGRGGNGGFNGGGRGGNGGFNGGGRGGNGGFNGGGRGGNNRGHCRYGVCCRRGYCQCCYSAAEATTEAKP
ncbi:hypothetical protein FRX31_032089 [Thalictrum thalictroides]|uniref:Glycine-rich protein n=1 Tax=Thalictrum thalictroides TaxID=46969 RepID=A0A7J6V1U3_THATH|nr:hypothetical protein FRX31_032089 [Thalictrum thalictroides]